MNTPFTIVTGTAVPLMLSNVDTDVIIRIERLTTLEKHQLGPYAFEALRRRADGAEEPGCVLNEAKFLQAPVLLAAENFGCGSSREGAVWALQGLGVRCVIAPSYGDIFWSNCFQNGVLPITLPIEQVQALANQCRDGSSIRIDLDACCIHDAKGHRIPFAIDSLRRDALLYGLDDIGLTLKDDQVIRAWQIQDRLSRPWAWPQVHRQGAKA
jgi:3-isopropylmalate/(R)-2-methylmalate dehydratase small subunit